MKSFAEQGAALLAYQEGCGLQRPFAHTRWTDEDKHGVREEGRDDHCDADGQNLMLTISPQHIEQLGRPPPDRDESNMQELAHVLATAPALARHGHGVLTALCKLATRVSKKRGEILFSAGDDAHCTFHLLAGEIMLSHVDPVSGNQDCAITLPPRSLDEGMPLLRSGVSRSATAICQQDSELLSITRQDFELTMNAVDAEALLDLLHKPPGFRTAEDLATIDKQCLQQLTVFKAWPPPLRHRIARHVEVQYWPTNSSLFRKGDAADAMYMSFGSIIESNTTRDVATCPSGPASPIRMSRTSSPEPGDAPPSPGLLRTTSRGSLRRTRSVLLGRSLKMKRGSATMPDMTVVGEECLTQTHQVPVHEKPCSVLRGGYLFRLARQGLLQECNEFADAEAKSKKSLLETVMNLGDRLHPELSAKMAACFTSRWCTIGTVLATQGSQVDQLFLFPAEESAVCAMRMNLRLEKRGGPPQQDEASGAGYEPDSKGVGRARSTLWTVTLCSAGTLDCLGLADWASSGTWPAAVQVVQEGRVLGANCKRIITLLEHSPSLVHHLRDQQLAKIQARRQRFESWLSSMEQQGYVLPVKRVESNDNTWAGSLLLNSEMHGGKQGGNHFPAADAQVNLVNSRPVDSHMVNMYALLKNLNAKVRAESAYPLLPKNAAAKIKIKNEPWRPPKSSSSVRHITGPPEISFSILPQTRRQHIFNISEVHMNAFIPAPVPRLSLEELTDRHKGDRSNRTGNRQNNQGAQTDRLVLESRERTVSGNRAKRMHFPPLLTHRALGQQNESDSTPAWLAQGGEIFRHQINTKREAIRTAMPLDHALPKLDSTLHWIEYRKSSKTASSLKDTGSRGRSRNRCAMGGSEQMSINDEKVTARVRTSFGGDREGDKNAAQGAFEGGLRVSESNEGAFGGGSRVLDAEGAFEGGLRVLESKVFHIEGRFEDSSVRAEKISKGRKTKTKGEGAPKDGKGNWETMTVGKGNWETITVHEDEDASKISRSGDRERQETSTHKEQILRDKEDSKRVLSLEDSKRMLSLEDKEDSKRVLSLLHESGDGTAPGDQSHMSWGKVYIASPPMASTPGRRLPFAKLPTFTHSLSPRTPRSPRQARTQALVPTASPPLQHHCNKTDGRAPHLVNLASGPRISRHQSLALPVHGADAEGKVGIHKRQSLGAPMHKGKSIASSPPALLRHSFSAPIEHVAVKMVQIASFAKERGGERERGAKEEVREESEAVANEEAEEKKVPVGVTERPSEIRTSVSMLLRNGKPV